MQRVKRDLAAAQAAIRDCDYDEWLKIKNGVYGKDLEEAFQERIKILGHNPDKSPSAFDKLEKELDAVTAHEPFPPYLFPCYPQTSPPAPRSHTGGGSRFGPRPSIAGASVRFGLEAGGGLTTTNFVVSDPFNVNAGGFAGGANVELMWPIKSSPDSLIFPVGARFGVLGSTMSGHTFYPLDGFTYTVKTPLIVYGEAELANPVLTSVVGLFNLSAPINVYSTVGVAGVFQNYSAGWSKTGFTANANSQEAGATFSVRMEWPIDKNVAMYLQYRSIYAPAVINIPGSVAATSYSNIVTVGVAF
jgi:hypothetical protein